MNARGVVRADGTFQLTTYRDGDGAVLGDHRVIVIPPPPADDLEEARRLPPPFDHRFMDYDTSNLRYTVTTDPQKNQFVIEVTPPAASGQ